MTGVMLAFANDSVFRGYRLNAFFRTVMFLKPGKRRMYLHALVFQILNVTLFAFIVIIYFLSNEKITASLYNVYKWTALIMFAAILLIAAIDAAVIEKRKKGHGDESN